MRSLLETVLVLFAVVALGFRVESSGAVGWTVWLAWRTAAPEEHEGDALQVFVGMLQRR